MKDVKGKQHIYIIDTCEGPGYYDSEMRNKIMASVEAARDHVHDGVALKKDQPVSKTHYGRTPVARRKGEWEVGGVGGK